MNQTLLTCALLYNSLSFTEPLLVAVLMIKNEAPVIVATLQPLADAGIKDFFIYDTGSTDDTIKITQEFFKKNKITNFKIVQEPWIDFSASRNRALRLTEQQFPDATFMLMVDSEWLLQGGKDLLKFCQQEKNKKTPLYHLTIHVFTNRFATPRLMRCKTNLYFSGKIHEQLNIVPAKTDAAPESVYFQRSFSDYGTKKSTTRWENDCKVLLEMLQENPNDARAAYFLAQTYHCLKDLEKAVFWYEKRAIMNGWDEENFLVLCRLAELYQELSNHDKMITTFFKAFNTRPTRAEPLIKIAAHYFDQQAYNLCYLLCKHAVEIPYPAHEASLVEKWLYDYVRYDLLARSAWSQNDNKLGKQACDIALKIRPDATYLHDYAKHYQEKLTQK
jgi:tetratricopeptide (TPR) repeat protein